MKLLTGLLVFAGLLSAADKRYAVCISIAGREQCTLPLTRNVAEAVFATFTIAPIRGLELVWMEDTKSKKKAPAGPHAQPQPDDPPPQPPGEKL